jgi:hypothetical protein
LVKNGSFDFDQHQPFFLFLDIITIIKWENKVAIWICFQNPIQRNFLKNKNEKRIESFMDIPVQYFSASFSYNDILDTKKGWSKTVPLIEMVLM